MDVIGICKPLLIFSFLIASFRGALQSLPQDPKERSIDIEEAPRSRGDKGQGGKVHV